MGICGSSAVPPNPNAIDLTHFELLKVVGKGGFGKVNAITKLDTGELMALKRIEKHAVLQSQSHLNMVWIERRIMSMTNSPFLCNLLYAFENDTELFLVMPFMQGGDLRYHLKERGTMEQKVCQFYAAEIVLGLAALHEKRVVFRDLKPENMLFDAEGHLRISDFGLASILVKEDNYKTIGQAGTRGYQAPEVISDQWYGTECDVWSFGVTIYELLHGARPWKDWTRMQSDIITSSNASSQMSKPPAMSEAEERAESVNRLKDFHISSRLSAETVSFLRGLLTVDVKKRLGCGPNGWEEVKAHPFFNGIDWGKIMRKELTPPIKPDLTHANCTADADLADQLLDRKPRPITAEQQKNFIGWAFNTEIKKQEDPSTTAVAPTSTGNLSSASTITTSASRNSTTTDKPISPQHHDEKTERLSTTTTTTTTTTSPDNKQPIVESKQPSNRPSDAEQSRTGSLRRLSEKNSNPPVSTTTTTTTTTTTPAKTTITSTPVPTAVATSSPQATVVATSSPQANMATSSTPPPTATAPTTAPTTPTIAPTTAPTTAPSTPQTRPVSASQSKAIESMTKPMIDVDMVNAEMGVVS